MIEVGGLTKRYGVKTALDNLSLTIKPGERLAIVGQNGAGKSTLLNEIIRLHDLNISFMPEAAEPDPDLNIYEFLLLLTNRDPNSIIDMCGLKEYKNTKCGHLSKGNRQRVMLALTLLIDRDIVVMDEPSAGMDPLFQKDMISLISTLCRDKTLIITSHNLEEVFSLANRIVVLKSGHISFDGELEKGRNYYEYF